MTTQPIALVLAGGGMRGAYEAGVLSALGPELDRRGERIEIIAGTSIGCWNGAVFASQAHRSMSEAADALVDFWGQLGYRALLEPVAPTVGHLLLAGLPPQPLRTVLDTTPMGPTLRRLIDFDQLARNVDDRTGPLTATAFVATSYATTRSVVFHAGRAKPQPSGEPIDYIETSLRDVHVRASSAIQAAFPAVNVPGPDGTAHWYGDGGARLNFPLEPALAMGAKSVIAIGLNSGVTLATDVMESEPFVSDGSAQMQQIALDDQLRTNIAWLSSTDGAQATPYIFVAPQDRFAIGRIARDVYNRFYTGEDGLRRDPDVALLGRIYRAGDSLTNGEHCSYLFPAREFIQELIALGRADANDWLSAAHTDGPWQVGTSQPRTGSTDATDILVGTRAVASDR